MSYRCASAPPPTGSPRRPRWCSSPPKSTQSRTISHDLPHPSHDLPRPPTISGTPLRQRARRSELRRARRPVRPTAGRPLCPRPRHRRHRPGARPSLVPPRHCHRASRRHAARARACRRRGFFSRRRAARRAHERRRRLRTSRAGAARALRVREASTPFPSAPP